MLFNDSDPQLDAVFGALAHPTRRALLARLAEGEERTVTELAAPFDVTLMAVSKHLATLERAGLVARESDGRFRRCRLTPAPLGAAAGWLAQQARFWNSSLDSLAAYVTKGTQEEAE